LRPNLGEKEYCRIGKPERYLSTPILLRQTAERPIAARHQPTAYFRNSVLACNGVAGVPDEVLVAVLNSELIGSWYSQRFKDSSQRTFPQVKIKALRELPQFPIGNLALEAHGGVDIRTRIIDIVHSLEDEADFTDEVIGHELEQLVRRLFGLAPSATDQSAVGDARTAL